jgi:hypothetical protein
MEAFMSSAGKMLVSAVVLSFSLLLLVHLPAKGSPKADPIPPAKTWHSGDRTCVAVGGMLMTNFGAIDQSTTLGPATGDLKGAVSATILGAPQPGSGGTVVFHIQHHWVTDSGDMINFDPAFATTVPLSSTLFAVTNYPVHITGGTGKFAGAIGDISNIGEADLVKGTVFRYSGHICYAVPED